MSEPFRGHSRTLAHPKGSSFQRADRCSSVIPRSLRFTFAVSRLPRARESTKVEALGSPADHKDQQDHDSERHEEQHVHLQRLIPGFGRANLDRSGDIPEHRRRRMRLRAQEARVSTAEQQKHAAAE